VIVSGEIGRRDVPAEWQLHRRVIGRRAVWASLSFGAAFVGAAYVPLLFSLIAGWPPEQQMPLLFAGLGATLVVYLAGYASEGWLRTQFARILIARGAASATQRVTIVIGETLRIETDHLVSDIGWELVSEIFPFGQAWVLLVSSRAYPVPWRFLADEEARRQFVREALGHMSEAARERSVEAREFVIWN
jgi:hypothetical protein